MANQIEMTTFEGPRPNLFRNSFEIFGKTPVTTKKTFSFNIGPPKVDKNSKGEDVTRNRIEEEQNKPGSLTTHRWHWQQTERTVSYPGQDRLHRKHPILFHQDSTTLDVEMLYSVSSVELP